MGWGRWCADWPGHGPFSNLPPWERPGWYLLWGLRPWPPAYYMSAYYDEESERRFLESYRLYLEDLKARIDDELRRVNERLSQLKK